MRRYRSEIMVHWIEKQIVAPIQSPHQCADTACIAADKGKSAYTRESNSSDVRSFARKIMVTSLIAR